MGKGGSWNPEDIAQDVVDSISDIATKPGKTVANAYVDSLKPKQEDFASYTPVELTGEAAKRRKQMMGLQRGLLSTVRGQKNASVNTSLLAPTLSAGKEKLGQ